jgi:HAD superfamily hydrolase (TIGR01509 family)
MLWICDVNGVLIDSTALFREAFAATAAHFGVPFSEEQFQQVKGVSPLEAYRRMHSGVDPRAERDFHLRYVRSRITDVRVYPHVREMLVAARETGIHLAAVTSHGAVAEAFLVTTGLYPLIDCLVTQEEVKRPKPHADALHRVLELFGIELHGRESERVVYVGDSILDIQAGKAAGIPTIGVTYGVSAAAEIREAEPCHVIGSFREMRSFLAPSQREASPATAV